MGSFFQSLGQSLKYILDIGAWDIVDISIVAVLLYVLIDLIRRTRTYKVFQGILILLLALWISGSGALELHTVNFILRNTLQVGLLALVILFQPELRRFLERLGTGGAMTEIFGRKDTHNLESAITQTVLAAAELSSSRTGALIIFEQENRLNDQIRTGTVIDADVTSELLKNIFYPKAPLHDGAVIIRSGRIEAAGCVLPLSGNTNLSKELGTRHRAGIGISESSDAVAVIISEETGAISVAKDGMLKRHLSRDTCDKLLRSELLNDENEPKRKRRFLSFLTKGDGHE